ncbi:Hypothetical predicted protein [Olea europaea subsp. europaea]|uniref:Uncharacterized protein n=1 Tax=Olea europaea subsp. europaea TaxID=158383 RepID=A0A8S0Q3V6_OLEEU|nr:Hypothetical predicted protein [Olea europaea subsp. europaea]
MIQSGRELQQVLHLLGIRYLQFIVTGVISSIVLEYIISFVKDVNPVWFILLQERKEYKEYKDKDCRELYRYKVLFNDVFDCDKYAVTPSQACRTRFAMLKDSGHENHHDKILVDVKIGGSSDEGGVAKPPSVTMAKFSPQAGTNARLPGSE